MQANWDSHTCCNQPGVDPSYSTSLSQPCKVFLLQPCSNISQHHNARHLILNKVRYAAYSGHQFLLARTAAPCPKPTILSQSSSMDVCTMAELHLKEVWTKVNLEQSTQVATSTLLRNKYDRVQERIATGASKQKEILGELLTSS